MKEEQDYLQDIAEIRSMMERSSRFLSLAGWAGIMAGIYALAGAFIAYVYFDFNPNQIYPNNESDGSTANLSKVIFLAVIILLSAAATAILLSQKKAHQKGEKLWNATTRRLVTNMAVPLIAGGLLILVILSKGLIGLIAPFTLLFYGLALYNASKFTYDEVRIVGLVEISLGLISAYFIEWAMLCWAIGFGVVHIVYGIYMHYRYEK